VAHHPSSLRRAFDLCGVCRLFFAVLCLFFAPVLAGDSGPGRFLSATMAIFWLTRVLMQLFYYHADLRKQIRLADAAFSLSALFPGSVFAVAALGLAG